MKGAREVPTPMVLEMMGRLTPAFEAGDAGLTMTSRDTHMPEWLEPMAATLTEERFSGPDWLFERKFDGIRLLAYKRGGEVAALLTQPPAAARCRRSPQPIASAPGATK